MNSDIIGQGSYTQQVFQNFYEQVTPWGKTEPPNFYYKCYNKMFLWVFLELNVPSFFPFQVILSVLCTDSIHEKCVLLQTYWILGIVTRCFLWLGLQDQCNKVIKNQISCSYNTVLTAVAIPTWSMCGDFSIQVLGATKLQYVTIKEWEEKESNDFFKRLNRERLAMELSIPCNLTVFLFTHCCGEPTQQCCSRFLHIPPESWCSSKGLSFSSVSPQ